MARGNGIIGRGNSFRVFVSYQDADGHRHQVTGTTHSITEAKHLRTKLQAEVDKGTFKKPSKLTLQAHFTQWLNGYVMPNLAPTTAETYRVITTKHILPRLGNVPLSSLTPQAVQALYSDKVKSGLSNATVQKIHNILHKSLENAVKTGLIVRNPLSMVECPKVQRREMRTMAEDDISRFLNEARKGEYYSLFFTLLFTGMRRGEALSLRWKDVDLLGCQLSIVRSMQFSNNTVTFKNPKTASSRRQIALSPSNCVVLRLHKESQNTNRQYAGLPHVTDDDLVFCQMPDGKPYLPNSVTHAWIKLTRKCGLDGVRLHDARHTHASLMLKNGTNPKVIQERLGHSSFSTTMNLYAHVSQGMQKEAANHFDDMVTGGTKVTIPLPL